MQCNLLRCFFGSHAFFLSDRFFLLAMAALSECEIDRSARRSFLLPAFCNSVWDACGTRIEEDVTSALGSTAGRPVLMQQKLRR